MQVVRHSDNDQLDGLIARNVLQRLYHLDILSASILGRRLGIRLAALLVGRQVGGPFENGMEGEEFRVGGDDRVVESAEG